MTGDEMADCYRGYIACLNGRRWAELERFVDDEVHYNGQFVGLDGYRQMLDGDVRAIPDLQFNIGLLIVEPPYVAAQLADATRKSLKRPHSSPIPEAQLDRLDALHV